MALDAPFISQRSVQQALDSMLFGGRLEQRTPLENLILVEGILNDPGMPNIEGASTFALHRLLIDLIQYEFAAQCRIFGLEEQEASDNRSLAFEAIGHIAHLQVPELTGWMLLYYRYVCADLRISPSDLLETVSVDVRTLRRYQANAVKELTRIISLQERVARQEKRKRVLYTKLPVALNDRILRRDELLAHAHSVISNGNGHLIITGSDGIGKTSFVQAIVKNLIDSNSVDQLVWLAQPRSLEYVHSHLRQVLLRDLPDSLKEYSLLNRLVIVLDDIDLLSIDAEGEKLFAELNNAIVLMTDRIHRQFGPRVNHIVLTDLDEDSVVSIVAAARPSLRSDPDGLNDFVTKLRELVGGNPLAVKLAANSLSNIDLHEPLFAEGQRDLIYALLLSSYRAVSHNTQIVLFMFVLMPVKPLSSVVLSTLWPNSTVTDDDLVTLLSCGLITHHTDSDVGYILPDTSRRFVQWLCGDSIAEQSRISALVEYLVTLPSDSLPLDVVEHILSQEWVGISPHQKQILAESRIGDGITHGNYAMWSMILERIALMPHSMNLKLYYAICTRQLSKSSQAEALFREIVDYCGHTGAFLQQGRGILELGILFRQQGLYEQAVALFERAKSILTAHNDLELLRKVDTEIAQTLLDSGEIDTLKTVVADLSTHSIDDLKVMILIAEILLLMNDYSGAKLYAERAKDYAQGANLGRVYATLGRINAEQGDFDSAQSWFDLAVSLLERGNDWYGLARAKSNLAAAFLQQRQYADDAEALLLQAQATQRTLNDRAGLIYTAHNIDVLNTAKWIDET